MILKENRLSQYYKPTKLIIVLRVNTFILFSVVLISCAREPDAMQPVYDKFPDSEIQYIELDEPRIITPDHLETIWFDEDSTRQVGLFQIISVEDRLATIGVEGKVISLIEAETGEVVKSVNTIGRGPGEYGHIGSISYDGETILALDMSSQKVIQYTPDLEYINEYYVQGSHVFSDIAFVDGKLFFGSGGFSDKLFKYYTLSDTSEAVSFHRYIIERGFQPSVYNRHHISVGNEHIYLLNNSLPLMFVYNFNNLDVPKIVRFQGEEMERDPDDEGSNFMPGAAHNLPPIEIPNDGNRPVGATPLFSNVVQSGNHVLVNQNKSPNLIYLTNRNGKLEYRGRYMLQDTEGNPFVFAGLAINPPWIYVGRAKDGVLMRFNMDVMK